MVSDSRAFLCRFKCVLSSQAMMRCLSLDSSYQTLSLSVSLLAVLVNDDEVAIKLCSHLGKGPTPPPFSLLPTGPLSRSWTKPGLRLSLVLD